MAEGVSGVTGTGWATPGESVATEEQGTSSEVSKEMFLQLLVAQIKYQDPLNPADGVEYLTQLAQFSNLEQLIAANGELEGIHDSLDAYAEEALAGDTSAVSETEDEG